MVAILVEHKMGKGGSLWELQLDEESESGVEEDGQVPWLKGRRSDRDENEGSWRKLKGLNEDIQ